MLGFGDGSQKDDLPLEQVKNMRNQGMSDNQIIQTLQRDGFSSSQIFDALNQADLTNGAPQQAPQPAQSFRQPEPQQQSFAPQKSDMDMIEEVAESIINEKWEELIKGVNKVLDWKQRTESRIDQLENRMDELRKSMDEINKMIMGRIDEYDKNVRDVGANVKAMEKVFKDVLPEFTNSVNELSEVSKRFKKTI